MDLSRVGSLSIVFGLVAALSTASPSSIEAQYPDRVQFGAGYVGNAPDVLGGGMAYAIFPVLGGLGVYVDAKFDIDSPEDQLAFNPAITRSDVLNDPAYQGAQFLSTETSSRSFNVAVVRPLRPTLFLYAGGGITQQSSYYLYSVPEQGNIDRALLVADPTEDEDKVNLMAGLILRISSVLSSQFGFESEPNGVTIGLSLRLPRW